MTMNMNPLRPLSVPSWPPTCTREPTEDAGSPFSRVGRRGKRRSPTEWAIRHCPLGSSFKLILRAGSSATGEQHDHRTRPIHKGETEAYKKAHRTKKPPSANIREAEVEVSKDELSKVMMVGTELAMGIQDNQESLGT